LKWKREIFVWIRRNPLKSPDSTKGIQGNPSLFPWFYLGFLGLIWINLEKLGRCADRLASPRIEMRARLSPRLASVAFQLAHVLLRVKLKAELCDQGELRLEEVDVLLLVGGQLFK
jgi:hypothetical protein